MSPLKDASIAGLVIGTEDATPLEFWVAVSEGQFLQLDDVVALERPLPNGETVRIFGLVTEVRARHEGARFDSDVFLILSKPELPIPLVTRFPFPSWATRRSEAVLAAASTPGSAGRDDPFEGLS